MADCTASGEPEYCQAPPTYHDNRKAWQMSSERWLPVFDRLAAPCASKDNAYV